MGSLRRRLLRWLVLAAVLGVALVTAGDVVALQVAESRAAAGLARVTAAERASVDLGGSPFLWNLVRGRIVRVAVRATGMTGGGLRVADLEVQTGEIRFSGREVVGLIRSPLINRARVVVSDVIARAAFDQQDLKRFIRSREPAVEDLVVQPSGVEVTFRDPRTGAVLPPARFLPRVEERRLVLRLVGLAEIPIDLRERAKALERSIDLPPIPQGLTVDVRLGSGSFSVEASGSRVVLDVGAGGLRNAAGYPS